MALTTSLTTLASKATPRNGFGGASAVWPALSSSRITPANPDASAKAPWTRTTVGPGTGFSSGLERWPQRRYVTRPERAGPGRRRPAHRRGLWRYQRSATWGYRSRQITRVADTLHFAPSSSSRLVQAGDLARVLARRIATHPAT